MFDFGWEFVYLGSAVIGGGFMLLQIVLGMLGGDADVDADVDVDADFDGAEGGGGLSIRALAAFLTFFGLSGMAATKGGLGPWAAGGVALVTGSMAFWLTGLLMAQMYKLRSSGTVDVRNAIGAEARVYLRVPGEKSGEGKVTVPLQGRTVEYRAFTAGRELRTGELCRVVAVHGPNTVEVAPPGEGA